MFKFVMTKNSNEIFHRAILHNDIPRTKLIIEEAMKDPRFNIDEINDEGLTALQFSCFAGYLEIVEILVAYGANWKIRDRVGYTLLHASAMAGNASVVRYLLRIGLKPISKADDGCMAIDVTDTISVIVILLRSMLDQGYLKEMQDYMLDHPQLKRNIFHELEKVKCREKEKNEILKDLPYSSHQTVRKRPDRVERIRNQEKLGRSLSTFSALSDSMQQLDKIGEDETNNDANTKSKPEPHYETIGPKQVDRILETTKRLRRFGSNSSCSSYSSRSSHYSNSSGGILKTDRSDESHNQTQKYLENRFPLPQKQVTFNLNNDDTSDYMSMTGYEDNSELEHRAVCLNETSTFNSLVNENSTECKEHLYENADSVKTKTNLNTVEENLYENFPVPPVPPRIPNRRNDSIPMYEDVIDVQNNVDRLVSSETDSGIDINETAGRVFALSLDDRRQSEVDVFPPPSEQSYSKLPSEDSYAKPVGLFYSANSNGPVLRQHNVNSEGTPSGFSIKANYSLNPKYNSWNGRSLIQQEHEEFHPYTSRRKKSSMFFEGAFDSKLFSNNNNNIDNKDQTSHKNSLIRNFQDYNFDHQPEIML